MYKFVRFFLAISFPLFSITTGLFSPFAQETGNPIRLFDKNHQPANKIIDGDTIQLAITLPSQVTTITQVGFILDDSSKPVTECSVPAGKDSCETPPFMSPGWYWQNGTPKETRAVSALVADEPFTHVVSIQVSPRPVVRVHGFSSTYTAWANYLGPDGYLATVGIHGFAVGDGQVEGVLNTGNIADPYAKTNTIAQNAAILGEYIANVKKATGAQVVDLMGHSMGGLISRYYIDRVMQERDVVQLIMLGSPMLGSDCANLPASLGLYLPAILEIRPSYVQGIFNQQVTHRRGVQFYGLAGVPIIEAFKSPCTADPSDIAVSLASVTGIPLQSSQMPVLHIDLNSSKQVFTHFVLPLLQKSVGEYAAEADPGPATSEADVLQFTHVYTGHVDPGGNKELDIPIDNGVTVALRFNPKSE